LVNEPGFRAASKADEFGLWLDEQAEPEPAGIDETVYGKSSGVLGFRQNRNEFSARVRSEREGRPRVGQFFLAHVQTTFASGRARIFQSV